MIDSALLLWIAFVFVPLLIFIFKPQWKFFAIVLSCASVCFCAVSDITLINNDNLWGLLQTELEVSKSAFVAYQCLLICVFIALVFVAYRYVKIRVIVFVYFTLCNVLLPFNIVERLLFGY